MVMREYGCHKDYGLEFNDQVVATMEGSLSPMVLSITALIEEIEVPWLFTK